MPLREVFDDFTTKAEARAAHQADSARVHEMLNWGVYADDPAYSSLQAAVDATPDYGVVIVPPGITEFSRVDIGSKTITLRGFGSFLTSSAVVGDTAWNNNANLKGSVLKSTATGGIAIDATNGRLHLENLAIIGANGLTTGVACGVVTNPYRTLLRWGNVQFANFAVGALVSDTYENVFQGINFRGCAKGFHLKGANSSLLMGCGMSVGGIGIHLEGAANVSILGGAIQGVTNIGLLIEASEECTVQGVYFENANANYAIDTLGISDRLVLLNNHTSTTGGDLVRVGSNHGHIWHGKYGNVASEDPSNLIVTGNYNSVYVSSNHGLLTNTGIGNVIRRVTIDGEILTGASQMLFTDVMPVLKSPDGTLYAVSVANDGTLSTQLA